MYLDLWTTKSEGYRGENHIGAAMKSSDFCSKHALHRGRKTAVIVLCEGKRSMRRLSRSMSTHTSRSPGRQGEPLTAIIGS